jgi:hypothetical protein
VRGVRYVAGMGENCMTGFGIKKKEPLRRYRFRWEYNIEIDLNCDDIVWRRYISGSG